MTSAAPLFAVLLGASLAVQADDLCEDMASWDWSLTCDDVTGQTTTSAPCTGTLQGQPSGDSAVLFIECPATGNAMHMSIWKSSPPELLEGDCSVSGSGTAESYLEPVESQDGYRLWFFGSWIPGSKTKHIVSVAQTSRMVYEHWAPNPVYRADYHYVADDPTWYAAHELPVEQAMARWFVRFYGNCPANGDDLHLCEADGVTPRFAGAGVARVVCRQPGTGRTDHSETSRCLAFLPDEDNVEGEPNLVDATVQYGAIPDGEQMWILRAPPQDRLEAGSTFLASPLGSPVLSCTRD